ncbi:MAG: hypothetical protein Q9214_007435 [Letrouitia sp. 1 TL-2023]
MPISPPNPTALTAASLIHDQTTPPLSTPNNLQFRRADTAHTKSNRAGKAQNNPNPGPAPTKGQQNPPSSQPKKTRTSPQEEDLGERPENKRPPPAATAEDWQIQKAALAAKFKGAGWSPRKRLSPDAVDGIRELYAQNPELYTTPVLAQQFQVSPEAVRRILKSRWKPSEEEQRRRRDRWEKRGQNIWNQLAEQGMKPPKKWRVGARRSLR